MFRRPVFVGGKACDFLEQTGKVLRILEAEFVGDLSDRLVGCQNPFLGRGDQLELDVLLGRFAGFLLDQIAEIVRGKAQFSGAPFYRRQPFALGAIPRKIVVEQPFEPGQNVMIDVRTGDELPLVEAQTVVEQHFDVDGDEPFAVAVDSVFQLLPDLEEAADDHFALSLREVQRLVHFIREE